ncbi:MAG: hypothetical protein ETSY1_40860 [Candidatus Entotheonella factor]|uniref:Uncharacterized protein n=1 Tax=Entotheonella factor TaxID=1429438 RepID=W4L5U6_ENTF1|nr:MAG: hypothetical protein ETSY1_40860 [Candidatus Entotheonella factor]
MEFINVFYALLTVFITVLCVIVIRVFGNLPISLLGPDLNLLTYGFLWDTSSKALRGVDYWPRFVPVIPNINASTTLFVIVVFNLLLLGVNLKLAHHAPDFTDGQQKWLIRPLTNTIGILSLIIFLLIQGMWES